MLGGIMSLPHGGAWIETVNLKSKKKPKELSLPHGGAWIETKTIINCAKEGMSLPHGGAWIETPNIIIESGL